LNRVTLQLNKRRRKTTSWRWSFALILTPALLGGCSAERVESVDPRPSILLVVIDTLRADAVSTYGAIDGTTPAFDALASGGIVYRRAYAPSPWTLPSHASLLTGLGPDRHGVGIAGRMGLRAELATLAERLADAGYQTAGFSENPLISNLFGFEKGFEQFAARSVEDAMNEENNPGSSPFDIIDEVADFAAKRDRERPFFVFVNLFDPHTPYLIREENRFLDPDVSAGDLWTTDDLKNAAYRICDRMPSAEELKILHGLYLGDVAESDAKLGRIEAIAREAAGEAPLIVMATADHGEHFGEHRLLSHEFSVRAPVLHIPLVVHGIPDVPAAEIDLAVALEDVPASVLDWAGVEIPPEFSGRPLPIRDSVPDRSDVDLVAVYSDATLQEPSNGEGHLTFSEDAQNLKRSNCWSRDRVYGDMVALTRWPFKLIWFENYPAELYDLSWDPAERSDLAELRPEVSGPLIEDAQRLARELGLANPNGKVETPSDAALEALKGLGYVE
jgi:arylsulfatase A-like enzyme